MIVASPMNEQELRNMMYTAQLDEQLMPFSIRYPRGEGVMIEWRTPFEKMEVGKGRMINDGEGLAILSFGPMGNYVKEAVAKLNAQGLHPAHFDMRFVKPIDAEMLHDIFGRFDRVLTIEDGCLQGGFGSAVIEFMVDNGYTSQVKRLGIPDHFVEHGSPEQLFEECGYGRNGIYQAALEMASEKVRS
jgi:1-deoxy-D-xylulose-5-phosphate synthase